jgi:F-type H+-transporting ATPase subunit b
LFGKFRAQDLTMSSDQQEGHTATTGMPADMDHGPSAFPPFETANFMPMLIWLALSFGLLYFLMSKIALPRVENILRTRANKITKDISEANAFRTQSEQAAAQHDKTIADARAKALALAQETHAKLNAETEAKRVALESELNAKLAAAEAQILEMKAKAMSNVEGIANETAAAIVEHITGKPADPRAIKAAVATA